MSSYCRNPTGKNGHNLPQAEDTHFSAILVSYHKEGKTSNKEIAQLLLKEHNIEMSPSTVKRRRKALGLKGAGATIKNIELDVAEQLVLSEMEKDITKSSGTRTIKGNITFNYGINLPRDYVRSVMFKHEPDAFSTRAPTAKKIHREPKHPIGIHHRWSADGHDKLYKIGFPIWAIVDDATSKWLGAWVVPSNRTGNVVAYMVLETIIKYRGMPVQLTTDCGSETTVVYGIMNQLRQVLQFYHPSTLADDIHREQFYLNIDPHEMPPHVYLRSVHNISVERSWLRLRLQLGDNAVAKFNEGIESGVYQSNDETHFELCQWLWAKLLQKELASFIERRNAAPMRKNTKKDGPSGMSRNDAFRDPERWNGKDYLLKIPETYISILREAQEELGGSQLMSFSTPEYAARAQMVYDSLNLRELNFLNVWHVFERMLEVMDEDMLL